MITSARATPSPATSGISRSVASRTRRGSFSRSAKSFAGALHRGREPRGVLVLQRDGEPAQRAPRRDVAAHRPGADDVHVRAVSAAVVLAERLQPLLQREHADQVAAVGRRSNRCIEAGSSGGARERIAVVALAHSSRIA